MRDGAILFLAKIAIRRQSVECNRIMDACLDIFLGKKCHQGVSLWNANDIQVIYMLTSRHVLRQYKRRYARKTRLINCRNMFALCIPGVKARQFHGKYRGLKSIKPGTPPFKLMVIFAGSAMIRDHTAMPGQSIIVAQ